MPLSWKQHFSWIRCCFLFLFERILIWCAEALSRALSIARTSIATVLLGSKAWQKAMFFSKHKAGKRENAVNYCSISLFHPIAPCKPSYSGCNGGTHPDRINTNLRNTNAFVKYNQQISVINVHRCRWIFVRHLIWSGWTNLIFQEPLWNSWSGSQATAN